MAVMTLYVQSRVMPEDSGTLARHRTAAARLSNAWSE